MAATMTKLLIKLRQRAASRVRVMAASVLAAISRISLSPVGMGLETALESSMLTVTHL